MAIIETHAHAPAKYTGWIKNHRKKAGRMHELETIFLQHRNQQESNPWYDELLPKRHMVEHLTCKGRSVVHGQLQRRRTGAIGQAAAAAVGLPAASPCCSMSWWPPLPSAHRLLPRRGPSWWTHDGGNGWHPAPRLPPRRGPSWWTRDGDSGWPS